MVATERQRFALAPPIVQPWIRQHVTWLEEELAELDQQLREAVQASPLWREREDLYAEDLDNTDGSAPETSI